MKKLFLYGGFGLAIGLSLCALQAASIIKTNTGDLSYFDQLQIFRTGESTVQGWVRLNRGFAVAPRATAFMDTFITVSGPMDLGETGTLVLSGNLFLGNSVTLTSGGNIKGKRSVSEPAGTIFLGGDLTLSATTYSRVLHIIGDWSNSGTTGGLIIDGMGHTLDIQDRAQIFVDTNITLTLRNMTIKTGAKSLNNPAIRLATPGSTLTLDNVIFDLGADFKFVQGQIFIHDEVVMTGTSAFVYQSPAPSYITSGATWSFEPGMTFSVAPRTQSVLPYSGGAVTNNNFIVLADQSSALSLNGCSLKTTYTGLRLSRGMVMCDSRVTIDTQAAVDMAQGTPLTYMAGTPLDNDPRGLAWAPGGRFLATVSQGTGNNLRVYAFDPSGTLTLVASTPVLNTAESLVWSPDLNFIAVFNYFSKVVQIAQFTGNGGLSIVAAAPTVDSCQLARWSPDGRFLLLQGTNANNIFEIFRCWKDGSLTSLGTVGTGSFPVCAEWSPDGRFIAELNNNETTNAVQIFRFNGSKLPASSFTAPALSYPQWITWSPDGRFLLESSTTNNRLQTYRFDGVVAPVPLLYIEGFDLRRIVFSPDGRYFAGATSSGDGVGVYQFNGNGTQVALGYVNDSPAFAFLVAWSPDGKFLAMINGSGSSGNLRIYRCNFVSTPAYQQGFTNGLVFGDRAKGSIFDATVNIAGNARVGIKGKVTDDSA